MHKNTVRVDRPEAKPEDAVVDPDYVLLGAVDLERGPIADLTITADGTTVVATHYGDGGVSVIDADDMTAGTTIDMPVEPFLVTATERRAYVTISGHNYDSVAIIDTDNERVIANHPVEGNAADVAVSPDGTRIFVGLVSWDGIGLGVINTFGRTHTIDLGHDEGRTIDAVRVSPDGRLVYVGTSDAVSGNVLVVDVTKGRVVREVPIPSPIRDIALSRDGGLAYVVSFHPQWGGSVAIIDTAIHEITAKVGIGGAPMQMALSADGARLYIADYEHVAVLCTETNSVIDKLTVTAEPACLAVSPEGGRLYIADHTGVITMLAVSSDITDAETEKLISLNISAAPELRKPEPAAV